MAERLSDEELFAFYSDVRTLCTGEPVVPEYVAEHARTKLKAQTDALLAEVRAMRLTPEDRELLTIVRSDLAEFGLAMEDGYEPVVQRKALALLDRLLDGGR